MYPSLCALLVVVSANPILQTGGRASYVEHFGRAWELDRAGEREEAAREYERALAWSPENPTCAYYLACNEASRGRTSESLAWLERAVDWGWSEAELTAADAGLHPLHTTPEFEALLSQMRLQNRAPAPEPQIYWSFGLGSPSISADGTRACSFGGAWQGGEVGLLWDVPSGELLSLLQSRGSRRVLPDSSVSSARESITWIQSLDFSADGSLVLATFSGSHARVFEPEAGDVTHELFGFDHCEPVLAAQSTRAIALSAPHHRVDSASIWDFGSDELMRLGDWRGSWPRTLAKVAEVVALSPDGKRALTGDAGDRNTAVLWDVETEARIAELPHVLDGELERAAFSADGRRAVVWGLDREGQSISGLRYRVIDGVDGSLLTEIQHCGYASRVAFLRNGTLLLTAGEGRVQSVDPVTGRVAWTVETGLERLGSFGTNATGDVLVTNAGGWNRPRVDAWDPYTSQRLWQRPGATAAFTFGDGDPSDERVLESMLVATETDLEQIDVHTGETLGHLRRSSRTPHYAEHRSRGTLLVGIGAGDLRELDLVSAGATRAASSVPADPLRLVCSPTGNRWAVATNDGRVWIGSDGETAPPSSLMAFELPVTTPELAFSPDTTRLLAFQRVEWDSAPQRDATVWRVEDGSLIARLTPSKGSFVHAAWNPTGELVATASSSGAVQVWSGLDGSLVGPSLQHPSLVEWVAFDPNSALLATACEDSYARVWNMVSGACLHAFHHTNWRDRRVRRVAFLDDGRRLLTASGKLWQVWCWDLRTDEKVWTYESEFGGSLWPVEAVPSSDESRLFVSGPMTAVLDTASGSTLADFTELEIEHVAPALDGAFIVGQGSDRLVVLHPESFETLYTWVPLDGDGELLVGPSGFYDGSVSAGRAAHVVLDEGSVPLDSYASVLLDPKRARAALQGIEVPAPALPAPPTLTVEEPRARFTQVESAAFRIVATARHNRPLLGFQVELDGKVLELDEMLAFVELDNERHVAKLSMPLPKPAQETSVALRICAVSSDGVLSRPIHRTFMFGE